MVDIAKSIYNRDNYRRNRDTILERRRQKYKQNRKFRQRQIERSKRSYRRRHAGAKPADRTVIRGVRTGEKFFSISKFAQFIGRSVQTVRWYHKIKVIPEPKHTDTRGWRLYTKEEVLVAQKAFKKFDRKEIKSLNEVKKIIHAGWGT